VSIKRRFRNLLLCLPLLLGALGGMPMRPEEIEDLMRSMNQQKVVVTVEDEGNEYTLPELPDLERVPPRLTVRPESPTRNRRFRS
jgi:hypothetical protein